MFKIIVCFSINLDSSKKNELDSDKIFSASATPAGVAPVPPLRKIPHQTPDVSPTTSQLFSPPESRLNIQQPILQHTTERHQPKKPVRHPTKIRVASKESRLNKTPIFEDPQSSLFQSSNPVSEQSILDSIPPLKGMISKSRSQISIVSSTLSISLPFPNGANDMSDAGLLDTSNPAGGNIKDSNQNVRQLSNKPKKHVRLPTKIDIAAIEPRLNITPVSGDRQNSLFRSSNPITEKSIPDSMPPLKGMISKSRSQISFDSPTVSTSLPFPNDANDMTDAGLLDTSNPAGGNIKDFNHNVMGLYNTLTVATDGGGDLQSNSPVNLKGSPGNLQPSFFRHSVSETRDSQIDVSEERDNFDPGK